MNSINLGTFPRAPVTTWKMMDSPTHRKKPSGRSPPYLMRSDGGISARDTASITYADSALSAYVIKSEPIGFVDEQKGYANNGTSITTPSAMERKTVITLLIGR